MSFPTSFEQTAREPVPNKLLGPFSYLIVPSLSSPFSLPEPESSTESSGYSCDQHMAPSGFLLYEGIDMRSVKLDHMELPFL